jgi:hypothetical protein
MREGTTPRDQPRDSLISHKVFIKSFLQKSIPAQIRRLILCISNTKEQDDGFVRELAFAKRIYKQLL